MRGIAYVAQNTDLEKTVKLNAIQSSCGLVDIYPITPVISIAFAIRQCAA